MWDDSKIKNSKKVMFECSLFEVLLGWDIASLEKIL